VKVDQFLAIVEAQLGKPYVFGDEGPETFDCSGLVQYALGLVGISAPRTSQEQQRWAIPVTTPRPGDLVFYGSPAYHVGVYIGNGRMINAPEPGTTVRVDPVGQPTGYGRVPGLATSAVLAPLAGAGTAAWDRVGEWLSGIRHVVIQGPFVAGGLVLAGVGLYLIVREGI
jgi:hypothetical protein